jgi:hypothetical protein
MVIELIYKVLWFGNTFYFLKGDNYQSFHDTICINKYDFVSLNFSLVCLFIQKTKDTLLFLSLGYSQLIFSTL